jgi:lysophospholipase L1-like esterase
VRIDNPQVARLTLLLSAVFSTIILEPLLADESTEHALSAMIVNPCQPALPVPGALSEVRDEVLDPNAKGTKFEQLLSTADIQAYFAALRAREQRDWANLCRYREDNGTLGVQPKVVFIGDSITENWVKGDPSLFVNGVIGRGIGGQTSPQVLLRFFQDVVDLHPQLVHIMIGANDIAGNTGDTTETIYKNNIRALVQLARANNIIVALASIPPAKAFPWQPALKPAETIKRLNAWLRDYALETHSRFIDYYSLLTDQVGGFRSTLSNDGVHPNRDGYAAMRKAALAGIH